MLTLKFKTLKRKETLTIYPQENPRLDQPSMHLVSRKILAGPPEWSSLTGEMGELLQNSFTPWAHIPDAPDT